MDDITEINVELEGLRAYVLGIPNGTDRTEKGRAAGLEGAVNYAIAEYGRVLRMYMNDADV